MRPHLSPGDPGQRAFRAGDASPQWNNPPERQGWALKQKGPSAAYIQSDVCATPLLFGFPAGRDQLDAQSPNGRAQRLSPRKSAVRNWVFRTEPADSEGCRLMARGWLVYVCDWGRRLPTRAPVVQRRRSTRSAASIKINVCATQSLLGFPATRDHFDGKSPYRRLSLAAGARCRDEDASCLVAFGLRTNLQAQYQLPGERRGTRKQPSPWSTPVSTKGAPSICVLAAR